MTMTTIKEFQNVQLNGKEVIIRPICAEDDSLEASFFNSLSPQAKHYRFLGGVSKLRPQMLKQLCTVDGETTMAFIAVLAKQGDDEQDVEIGACRYAPTDTPGTSELAVTIADDWQGTGLGEALLSVLFDYAKTHGIAQLYSVDDAENDGMRQLADAMEMEIHPDPHDIHQVIYYKPL